MSEKIIALSLTATLMLGCTGFVDDLIQRPVAAPQRQAPASLPVVRHETRYVKVPAELESGLRAFSGCQYEAAIQLLDEAANNSAYTLAERAKAYLYSGVACFYVGREEGARARFKTALQWQPSLAPAHDEFTPEAVHLFDQVKSGN